MKIGQTVRVKSTDGSINPLDRLLLPPQVVGAMDSLIGKTGVIKNVYEQYDNGILVDFADDDEALEGAAIDKESLDPMMAAMFADAPDTILHKGENPLEDDDGVLDEMTGFWFDPKDLELVE